MHKVQRCPHCGGEMRTTSPYRGAFTYCPTCPDGRFNGRFKSAGQLTSFSLKEWDQLEDLFVQAKCVVDLQAHARRKYRLDVAERGLTRVPISLLTRILTTFSPVGWDNDAIHAELPYEEAGLNPQLSVLVPAALIVDSLKSIMWMRRHLPTRLRRVIEKWMTRHDLVGGEALRYEPITSVRLPKPKVAITSDNTGRQTVSVDYYLPKQLKGATATATYIDEAGKLDAESLKARTDLSRLPSNLRALAKISDKWSCKETKRGGTLINIHYHNPDVPIGIDLVESGVNPYTTCDLRFFQNDHVARIHFTLSWKKEELPHYTGKTVSVQLCLPEYKDIAMGVFKVTHAVPVANGTRFTLVRRRSQPKSCSYEALTRAKKSMPSELRALGQYTESEWKLTKKGSLTLECSTPTCLKIGCETDSAKYIRACGLRKFRLTKIGTEVRLLGEVVDVSGRAVSKGSWAELTKLSGSAQNIMLVTPQGNNIQLGFLQMTFYAAEDEDAEKSFEIRLQGSGNLTL